MLNNTEVNWNTKYINQKLTSTIYNVINRNNN